MKPTKRKAFNFLRSYFDVYNKLKKDSDKLQFLNAIINKQFLNEDPINLSEMADFGYESQRYPIEKSIKGWLRASGSVIKSDPTLDPILDPTLDPKEEKEEEEEEEKEEEKEVYYSNKKVPKKTEKVFSDDLFKNYDKILELFPDHLRPKNEKIRANWLGTIDKLIRIEKIPYETIETIVRKTRADDFWSKNFLSLPKLRKKNRDGIMYIVVFNEKIADPERKIGRQNIETIIKNSKGW